MNERELLPCPFCGSPAKQSYSSRDLYHYIICEADCAVGPCSSDRDEHRCVTDWNRRSAPAPAQAEAGQDFSDWIWKLTPIALPISKVTSHPTTFDPISGKRAGIQFASTLDEREIATDSCLLCTRTGPHSHTLEDLEALQKMITFLEGKLGITHPAALLTRQTEAQQEETDNYKRRPTAGKCQCGLHEVSAGADGVRWYWQRHTREGCTLELPNKMCWCGLLRSEHITGHSAQSGKEGK